MRIRKYTEILKNEADVFSKMKPMFLKNFPKNEADVFSKMKPMFLKNFPKNEADVS